MSVRPAMEDLVRPFTDRSITPALRGPGFEPDPPEGQVAIKLGGSGGTTTSFTMDGGGFIVKQEDENFKEVDRKSTLVRVENEDDPDQFVELCRPNSIKFASDKEEKKPPVVQKTLANGGNADPGRNPDRGGPEPASIRKYSYDHPKDKTCKSPPKETKRGCG